MIDRICESQLMEKEEQVISWNNAHRHYIVRGFVEWFRYRKDKSGIIVDAGCGTGLLGVELLSEFPELKIKAYDGSELMIKYANENIKKNNLENSYEASLSMIEDIGPIDDCKTIISMGVLHHYEDPMIFWNSLKSISSKPGSVWMIIDLVRPESRDELNEILYTIETKSSSTYIDDLKKSLYAAFSKQEVEDQLSSLGLPYRITKNINPIAGELMLIQVRF
jgi:2-polyprenyl-3-methyl-5-hydroxy-6-metoxy-1,4-benzoquinol methylase